MYYYLFYSLLLAGLAAVVCHTVWKSIREERQALADDFERVASELELDVRKTRLSKVLTKFPRSILLGSGFSAGIDLCYEHSSSDVEITFFRLNPSWNCSDVYSSRRLCVLHLPRLSFGHAAIATENLPKYYRRQIFSIFEERSRIKETNHTLCWQLIGQQPTARPQIPIDLAAMKEMQFSWLEFNGPYITVVFGNKYDSEDTHRMINSINLLMDSWV